eukprot:scaffold74423_cov27-Tisochrysis_lutea.AAC.6
MAAHWAYLIQIFKVVNERARRRIFVEESCGSTHRTMLVNRDACRSPRDVCNSDVTSASLAFVSNSSRSAVANASRSRPASVVGEKPPSNPPQGASGPDKTLLARFQSRPTSAQLAGSMQDESPREVRGNAPDWPELKPEGEAVADSGSRDAPGVEAADAVGAIVGGDASKLAVRPMGVRGWSSSCTEGDSSPTPTSPLALR